MYNFSLKKNFAFYFTVKFGEIISEWFCLLSKSKIQTKYVLSESAEPLYTREFSYRFRFVKPLFHKVKVFISSSLKYVIKMLLLLSEHKFSNTMNFISIGILFVELENLEGQMGINTGFVRAFICTIRRN